MASVVLLAAAAAREWSYRRDLHTYRQEEAAWQQEWGQHSPHGELEAHQRDAPAPPGLGLDSKAPVLGLAKSTAPPEQAG